MYVKADKRILMLATGGTIASMESGSGLAPAITSQELLDHVPQIAELCHVETVQLFNLDSTCILPAHWLELANTIKARYDEFDGFVITHGTDTMAYTAAALSYLVQRSPKPIVITGAQKSIALMDTDARRNLYDSFLYATDEQSQQVSIVFDGKVIHGTRARKERTKSYNAFSSVDYPEIAVIRDGRLIRYLSPENIADGPVFYDRLDERVLLLTLIPGMQAHALNKLVEDYQGLILQSFGVGGLPGSDTGELAQALESWLSQGKTIVMMTQVPYEGSDMAVYQVGQRVKKKYELIETYSMTMEAAVTKLMWAMGQSHEQEKVSTLFTSPVQYDIIR